MSLRQASKAWVIIAELATSLVPVPSGVARAKTLPQVWMVPVDQFRRSDSIPGSTDYMHLFDEPSSQGWGEVVRHVNVWKLYPRFAAMATDGQLRTVFTFLRLHKIALALEYPPLTSGAYCKGKIEGFGGENLVSVVRRFAASGGQLDYLAMDEPLFYGHHFDGTGACRTAISTLTTDIAANVKEIRKVFPNVLVGDIEPGTIPDGNWGNEVATFMRQYRSKTGAGLSFLHLDIDWSEEWTKGLKDLADRARIEDVPFGVIYGASGQQLDDIHWAKEVEENYTLVEDVLGGPPANILFQSWVRWPAHALPATAPDTAAGILARYFQASPKIYAQREGKQSITGLLTGPPGSTIHLEARGLSDETATLNIGGRVPAGAMRALLAARFNAECGCSGSATLRLGASHYWDGGGTDVVRLFSAFQGLGLSTDRKTGRATGLIVEARGDRPMRLNTLPFPVTAGQAFKANFELSIDPAAGRVGYVSVIWLDSNDKEISRMVARVKSAWREVVAIKSDRGGKFRIAVPEEIAIGHESLRLRYTGTADLRSAVKAIVSK